VAFRERRKMNPTFFNTLIIVFLFIPAFFAYIILVSFMQYSFYHKQTDKWVEQLGEQGNISPTTVDRLFKYLKPEGKKDETLTYKKYVVAKFLHKHFKNMPEIIALLTEKTETGEVLQINPEQLISLTRNTTNIENIIGKIKTGHTYEQIIETINIPNLWSTRLFS
jgi:DNA-binding transcriptional regulator YhcF (GntR family)